MTLFVNDTPFTPEDFLNKLIPNFWSLLINLLALIVFFVALYFIAYKPLRRLVDARRAKMRGEREEGERLLEEGRRREEETRTIVGEAEKRSSEILKASEEEGERIRAERVLLAEKDIAEREKAQKERIRQEEERSRARLREETVDLALRMSEKLLGEKMDEEKDRALIEWYRRQIAKLGIEVKFNTEVKDIASLGADEVVVATGAKPRKLGIPGIEKGIEAIDYLNGAAVGDNVVIIGGGLTGCEIAYDLFLKGKHPVIVEAQNDIITTPGLCLANSSYLRDYFAWKKVPVLLESKVKKVSDGAVTVETADGKTKEIKADSVIVSVGYVPAPLAEKSAHVHIVGDAEKVGNLRTVVWKAWEVAEKL